MRRFVAVTALAAVTLLLGLGPAASAQTNTTLPLPAGQGGPDNNVNSPGSADNAGGTDNPAVDAGPAVSDGDDSSIAPWLIGAGILVLLAAGAAVVARRATADRRPSYTA